MSINIDLNIPLFFRLFGLSPRFSKEKTTPGTGTGGDSFDEKTGPSINQVKEESSLVLEISNLKEKIKNKICGDIKKRFGIDISLVFLEMVGSNRFENHNSYIEKVEDPYQRMLFERIENRGGGLYSNFSTLRNNDNAIAWISEGLIKKNKKGTFFIPPLNDFYQTSSHLIKKLSIISNDFPYCIEGKSDIGKLLESIDPLYKKNLTQDTIKTSIFGDLLNILLKKKAEGDMSFFCGTNEEEIGQSLEMLFLQQSIYDYLNGKKNEKTDELFLLLVSYLVELQKNQGKPLLQKDVLSSIIGEYVSNKEFKIFKESKLNKDYLDIATDLNPLSVRFILKLAIKGAPHFFSDINPEDKKELNLLNILHQAGKNKERHISIYKFFLDSKKFEKLEKQEIGFLLSLGMEGISYVHQLRGADIVAIYELFSKDRDALTVRKRELLFFIDYDDFQRLILCDDKQIDYAFGSDKNQLENFLHFQELIEKLISYLCYIPSYFQEYRGNIKRIIGAYNYRDEPKSLEAEIKELENTPGFANMIQVHKIKIFQGNDPVEDDLERLGSIYEILGRHSQDLTIQVGYIEKIYSLSNEYRLKFISACTGIGKEATLPMSIFPKLLEFCLFTDENDCWEDIECSYELFIEKLKMTRARDSKTGNKMGTETERDSYIDLICDLLLEKNKGSFNDFIKQREISDEHLKNIYGILNFFGSFGFFSFRDISKVYIFCKESSIESRLYEMYQKLKTFEFSNNNGEYLGFIDTCMNYLKNDDIKVFDTFLKSKQKRKTTNSFDTKIFQQIDSNDSDSIGILSKKIHSILQTILQEFDPGKVSSTKNALNGLGSGSYTRCLKRMIHTLEQQDGEEDCEYLIRISSISWRNIFKNTEITDNRLRGILKSSSIKIKPFFEALQSFGDDVIAKIHTNSIEDIRSSKELWDKVISEIDVRS